MGNERIGHTKAVDRSEEGESREMEVEGVTCGRSNECPAPIDDAGPRWSSVQIVGSRLRAEKTEDIRKMAPHPGWASLTATGENGQKYPPF